MRHKFHLIKNNVKLRLGWPDSNAVATMPWLPVLPSAISNHTRTHTHTPIWNLLANHAVLLRDLGRAAATLVILADLTLHTVRWCSRVSTVSLSLGLHFLNSGELPKHFSITSRAGKLQMGEAKIVRQADKESRRSWKDTVLNFHIFNHLHAYIKAIIILYIYIPDALALLQGKYVRERFLEIFGASRSHCLASTKCPLRNLA